MIWADRSALLVGLMVFMVLAAGHSPAREYSWKLGAILLGSARNALLVMVGLWIALRLIDLIAGGPRRRRSEQKDAS